MANLLGQRSVVDYASDRTNTYYLAQRRLATLFTTSP